MSSLPEIATLFDPKAVIGGAGSPSTGFFALAAIPARYALERQDLEAGCATRRQRHSIFRIQMR